MIFTHTTSPEEILAAKHLLYNFYIKRMGWQFPKDAPTGWTITEVNGRKILDDRYHDTSRWYVGHRDGKVEVCLRVLHKTADSPLDVEHYNTTPAFEAFLATPAHYVELNRFGFIHEDRIFDYMLNFWILILEEGLREGWTFVVTNGFGNSERFTRVGLSPIPGAAFKYHPDDSNIVSTFGIPPEDIPRILNNCRQILQHEE
jgi:hypothetical protein